MEPDKINKTQVTKIYLDRNWRSGIIYEAPVRYNINWQGFESTDPERPASYQRGIMYTPQEAIESAKAKRDQELEAARATVQRLESLEFKVQPLA